MAAQLRDNARRGVGRTPMVHILHCGVGEHCFVTEKLWDGTGGGIRGTFAIRRGRYRCSGVRRHCL